MAHVLPPEGFDTLHEAAGALWQRAVELAHMPGGAVVRAEDPEEAKDFSYRVTALLAAFHAVSLSAKMTEPEIMIALASTVASIFGQCQSSPKALWDLYTAQLNRSLAEIRHAQTPVGNA